MALRALVGFEALLAVTAIPVGALLALFPSGGGPIDFDLRQLDGSPFDNYLLVGYLASPMVIRLIPQPLD